MTMNRNDAKEAFREVVSDEFIDIPAENEISYTFSERFYRKMNKLLRKQKMSYWNLISTTSKKLVFACLLCLVFSVSACGVKIVHDYIESHKQPEIPEVEIDLKMVNWQEDEADTEMIQTHLKEDAHAVVFYGRDLDADGITERYFADKSILKLMKGEKPQQFSEVGQVFWRDPAYGQENVPTDLDGNFTDKKSTYAIVAVNIYGKTILAYHSMTYEPEWEGQMEYYFEEMIDEEVIAELAVSFALERRKDLMGETIDLKEVFSVDTYFDMYSPDNGSTNYMMKMYEKTEHHRMAQVSDQVEREDYYDIGTIVEIVPGNQLSQQHPEYKHSMVVIGVQTDYSRKCAEDYYIGANLGYYPEITEAEIWVRKGFSGMEKPTGFLSNPDNTILGLYASDWDSEAVFYGGVEDGRHWNISNHLFRYGFGIYVGSYGDDFSWGTGTQIKTMLVNEGISDAKWTGRPQTLTFGK